MHSTLLCSADLRDILWQSRQSCFFSGSGIQMSVLSFAFVGVCAGKVLRSLGAGLW